MNKLLTGVFFLLFTNLVWSRDNLAVVATVGEGKVNMESVMEIWGPSWNEVIAKAHNGKIAPAEVDQHLQKEWQKALDTAIRDEVFFLEAQNDFDRAFQRNVDKLHEARRSEGWTRTEAERRLREWIDKFRNRQISIMIEKNIKAAGGIDNLSRVLIARGITFDEWKNRIVRKAHTYSYLYSLFEPLGNVVQPSPKEVKKYYTLHADEFTEAGAVEFKHIFIDNEKHQGEAATYQLAEKIYTEISEQQITFADAVRQYSEDEDSARRGGVENAISPDFDREAWLSDVRSAVRDQVPEELGPVLISPRGCHLAVLVKIDAPKTISFDIAQKTIIGKMENDKWEKSANQLYEKLKAETLININLPTFPSDYTWENNRTRKNVRQIGIGAGK